VICKQNGIKGYSNLNKGPLIDLMCGEVVKNLKVPKHMRKLLWISRFGYDDQRGICYACSNEITIESFEAGHIISAANGGEAILDNLEPICKDCNRRCGIRNLNEYKRSIQSSHPMELRSGKKTSEVPDDRKTSEVPVDRKSSESPVDRKLSEASVDAIDELRRKFDSLSLAYEISNSERAKLQHENKLLKNYIFHICKN
jgi:hypothetical protein